MYGMRALTVMSAVTCVLLAGCGGSEPPPPALPGVQLRVSTPMDASTTQGEAVLVSGIVRPASATVLVGGDEATMSGEGRFSKTVELQPGTNVVDVEAGAPRRPAAMTALRITREVPIEVPDVAGDAPDDAEGRLRALGFTVRTERGGGLLDELVPGTLGVCGSDPGAGERIRPGSTVTLEVRKTC